MKGNCIAEKMFQNREPFQDLEVKRRDGVDKKLVHELRASLHLSVSIGAHFIVKDTHTHLSLLILALSGSDNAESLDFRTRYA